MNLKLPESFISRRADWVVTLFLWGANEAGLLTETADSFARTLECVHEWGS